MLRACLKRLHAPIHESRIQVLARRVTPYLREGDRVLDVGCGTGDLGRGILETPTRPAPLQFHGLELHRRQHELIDVQAFDGLTIPYARKTYDVVILADVLHHVADPERLIQECIRVSKRLLIIKDHQVQGLFARQRLVLLDWMANAPFGVPCLYQFWTAAQWTALPQRYGLTVEQDVRSMPIFPFGFNFFFGGSLHYFAVLNVPPADSC